MLTQSQLNLYEDIPNPETNYCTSSKFFMASLVKKAKTQTKVFSWDYSLHIITYPKSYAKETPFMDLLLNSHHPYMLGSTTVQTP